jgi:hypothetical protein
MLPAPACTSEQRNGHKGRDSGRLADWQLVTESSLVLQVQNVTATSDQI